MLSPLAALLRLHELEHGEDPSAPESGGHHRLAREISPLVMARYRSARDRYGADALAPLERNVCTGCHVRQPSKAEALAEDIFRCDSCSRILYDPNAAYDFSGPAAN